MVAGSSNQGGSTGTDFAVARLNADASLDTDFSGDGKATVDFGSTSDIGYSVAVDSLDRIVVAGRSYQGGSTGNDFAVARLLGDAANAVPVVGEVSGPLDPSAVNTSVSLSASFTDAGTPDTHTATWDWGDETSPSAGTVDQSAGSGTVQDSHVYTAAGVYTVTLTVTDNNGASAQSVFQYVVVYDPEAGFVAGGGTIDSPASAYAADPTLAGPAQFAFVSKYHRGASSPTGQTRFSFKVGDFTFESTSYDWMVVSGARAQYKGSGTVNGGGDYGFMITLVDGDRNGGGGVDKFRIKIWDKATGSTVYDNQLGDDDDAEATTAIRGGSIHIQTK